MRDDFQFALDGVGIVVIGRNEGERLHRCLRSVLMALPVPARVVYVDSGSQDDSVALARGLSVEVVELDAATPFSAARARNAGYDRLLVCHPDLPYVQFIDGDCELFRDWLTTAIREFAMETKLAIAAGGLRERSPETSIYNRLAELEWNFAGVGVVDAVGGIFMVRRLAFDSVGGFDASIAAGEEPELCARLIRGGWRLRRLDKAMATHDLAMTRFGQWCRRTLRFGYASFDVAGRFALPKFRRANLRARAWGVWLAAVPMFAVLLLALPSAWTAAALAGWLLLWPVQCARIAWHSARSGTPAKLALVYAIFMMLTNVPHLAGQAWCWVDRRRGRRQRLVEHKSPCRRYDAAKANALDGDRRTTTETLG